MIYDLIIIGGGAAGLVLGNIAKQRGYSFVILERAPKVGKKILATGNGKCNLTNLDMKADYYNNTFVSDVLRLYPPQKIIDFFEKLGMKTKAVEKRIYPYNETSHSVVGFLVKNIKQNIKENFKVESIRKEDNIFIVNDKLRAKKIFFATGTNATTGEDSLHLLKGFGHSVKALKPSLVWLKTDGKYIKGLNGMRAKAEVRLLGGRKEVARQKGEILFKKEGISGIAIFMLSAYIARNIGKYSLSIDFASDMKSQEIVEYDLQGLVKEEIAKKIVMQAKDRKTSPQKIVKDFVLEVTAPADIKYAQVLSGGFEIKDINSKTMESKLISGLFIGGECMDIDGQCGGYNLHWAFASAMATGDNMKI